MSKLTPMFCKNQKKIGMYSDGGGLNLKVQASKKDGSSVVKSWIFRWGAGGKFTMGLGPYPAVSIPDARQQALDCKKLIAQGINPREQKMQHAEIAAKKTSIKFAAAANEFIEIHKSSWKNEKHAQQWTNTLDQYALPVIGKKDCAEVTVEDMLKILSEIWTKKNETATRLRGRIEKILDWAIAKKLSTEPNPARWKGALNHLLPNISKRIRVKHHAAMPYADIPNFMQQLRQLNLVSANALQFCILTALRTDSVLKATWDEVDLDKEIWVIPKEKMKLPYEHRVPLPTRLMAILKAMPRIEGVDYIFPSPQGRNKPLSNMAMLNLLKKTMGFKQYTVHGFRSSFREFSGEVTNHSREVIEQAMAHQLTDQAEAAYMRGDYMKKRQVLMQDWEDYCFSANQATGTTNAVAPI